MTKASRTRTATTKRIAAASIVNRAVTTVCRFAARTVFAERLGTDYLGVGGMFGNIFGVLTVIEGGIGEALSQMLYRPLAEGDDGCIAALFRKYRSVCRAVALVSLAAALLFWPFLPRVFRDITRIDRYNSVYGLYCLHQLVSYLFAPYIALIVRDRRGDLLMNCRSVTCVLSTLIRVRLLERGGSYFAYMAVQIAFLAVDGLYAVRTVGKLYPYIKNSACGLPQTLLSRLKKSAKALYVHRVADVINRSTDSLLISSVLGLSRMGVYSNYALIVGTVGSFTSLLIGSASAAVGNLGVSDDPDKSIRVLKRLCRLHFLVVTNAAAFLAALLTPAVALWQGSDMCFDAAETAVIAACFYLSNIRDPVQIFLNAYGIFDETKRVCLLRGLLNLVLSLIFVRLFGMVGVFAGTLLSTLATVFLSEPRILFRVGFDRPAGRFTAWYTFFVVGGAVLVFGSAMLLSPMPVGDLRMLLMKAAATASVVNAPLCAVYFLRRAFEGRSIKNGAPVSRSAA